MLKISPFNSLSFKNYEKQDDNKKTKKIIGYSLAGAAVLGTTYGIIHHRIKAKPIEKTVTAPEPPKAKDIIQETIKKCADEISKTNPELVKKFNSEEAKELNKPLKDYLQYRTIFAQCIENNKPLQKDFKKAGIKSELIPYELFVEKYADKEKDYSQAYYLRYFDALKSYTADLMKHSPHEYLFREGWGKPEASAEKIVMSEELKKHLETIEKICKDNLPEKS